MIIAFFILLISTTIQLNLSKRSLTLSILLDIMGESFVFFGGECRSYQPAGPDLAGERRRPELV